MEFDEAQLQNLPEDFKEQVQNAFEQHKRYIEELKENLERAKVESEQKCFDLEKQLITSNAKLQGEAKSSSELRQQHTELERRYDETARRIQELQQQQLDSNKQCTELESSNNQLEADKAELSSLLDRKDKEIDRMNDEWTHMSQKVSLAIKEKMDMLAQLNKVQSVEMTMKHRETRLEQEKEQLQQHHQWLENELQCKTAELQSTRRDKSSRLLELQAEVEQKTDELSHVHVTMESLRQNNLDQATKIENYIQKLRDSRDAQTQIEEQYRNEVQAQERLVGLYKSSAKEAEGKVVELTTAVEELQKLLKQASEAHSEVKKQRETDIENRDERITQLSRELKDANDLIETLRKKGVVPLTDEAVEMLAPAAAATSKLLKSGMTLTQIYSEYVQVSESLHLEKAENERLNAYLDEILQELEEKAPLMRKQRDDYEKARVTVQQTTKQLDGAMLECEKLRKSSEESTRRCGELFRENQRLKQQSVDLAQQVRLLLKELEESRGTVFSLSEPEPEVSSSEVSSSSQIISQKLVTFRSIEELQQQNQRLLEVARDLSDKQEKEEQTLAEDKLGELKLQLSLAMQEIDQMKEARDKQASMVESIIRQRDMYKVLLAQSGSTLIPSSPATPQTRSPVPAKASPVMPAAPQTPDIQADRKAMEETTEALKELQEAFNIYRKEKAENERLLNQQLEKLRSDSSDARVQNARLASQLDFAGERYKILQGNIDGYKKEINALREKNQKLTASVIKYEESLNLLRQDLMNSQEAKTLAEVHCQNLKAEKSMLKNSEARLLQEKESIMREKQTQNLLLANLQAIQNNLERSEFETKTKLSQRIEDMEKESNVQKQKLEAADSQHRSVIETLDRQLRERGVDIERKTKALLEQQTKLRESNQQLGLVRSELSQIEAQYVAAENRLSNVAYTGHPSPQDELKRREESIKDLKSQMNMQVNQIKALKEQLVKTTQHMEQYKQLASSSEQTLQQHTQASQEFQKTMEAKVKELSEAKLIIEKENKEICRQRQELIGENLRMTEDYQKETGELRRHMGKSQQELEELVDRQEQAIHQEQEATADLGIQSRLALETQDKYERELILHAADVETLTQVKHQLDGFNQKLVNAEEECKNAKDSLKVFQESWKGQEQALKQDCQKQESRVTELQQQNTALHEQLHKLSEQMVALQESQARDDHFTAELVETVQQEESQRSTEQLLQVLKFLRKEKDIAEAKLDLVQAESTRLRQQLDYSNKQLQDANTTLSEERQKAQSSLQTAAQHADLLRKVENLNLLQDSNRLLREDKERTVQLLKQMEIRAKTLEDEIEPLQATNRDLSYQCEALQTEKLALQKEADSWRNRTNKLIEQYNKTDPEEFKRIIAERLQLKKQVATSAEEISKHKADASRLNMILNTARNEATNLKQQVQKLNEELQEAKKSTEVKSKNMEEKNKNLVVQLRKIGRKYRVQAEEAQKELDIMKAKSDQQPEQLKISEEKVKAAEEKIKASEEKVKDTEEKVKGLEEKLSAQVEELKTRDEKVKAAESKATTLEEKVKSVLKELAEITENLGASDHEKHDLNKRVKEEENRVKLLTEQANTHQQDAAKWKEAETKLKEEMAELDKKHKALVQRVKPKLQENKEQIEKLMTENTQLKQQLSGVQAKAAAAGAEQQQQHKSKITQLEKELEESRSESVMAAQLQQEVDRLKNDNTEMQHRMQLLQKQVENQQKPVTTPAAVSAPPVERAGAATSETPTANIRPMASPANQPRHLQSAPVQPVRATTAETRAMASIRPMAQAVSPMTMTAATTVTPTATVMPTTVNVAEDVASSSHGAQRPTQPVQPVSTHTEPAAAQPSTEETPAADEVASEAAVSQTILGRITPEPQPSTSQPTTGDVTFTISSKRPREETDLPEEDAESDVRPKRSRTQQEAESETASQELISAANLVAPDDMVAGTDKQEEAVLPPASQQVATVTALTGGSVQSASSTVSQSNKQQVIDVSADPTEVGTELPDYPEVLEQQQTEESLSQVVMEGAAETDLQQHAVTEVVEQEDVDDVIVLDEAEGEETGYGGELEEGQEEVMDYVEEYENEEVVEDEQCEEVEDGGEDEDIQTEVETQELTHDDDYQDNGGDDDVVIILGDDDDDQPPAASQLSQEATPSSSISGSLPSTISSQTSGSSQDSLRPPTSLTRVPSTLERQASMGRGQLPPFVLGSDGGFEVGDDSIVPSTPTLVLPKRTDGFAEAVSSPSVHQRFIFSSQEGGLPQSGLAQLASQGALGMDDTKMDLSQFDDATPGIIAGTPQARTTPTISVTAASPPAAMQSLEEAETQEQSPEQQLAATVTQGQEELDTTDSGEVQPQEATGEKKDEAQVTSEGITGQEAKPGTSEAGDEEDQEDTPAKPKIQRIVWDAPAEPTTSPSPLPTQPTVPTPSPPQLQAQPIIQPSNISVIGQPSPASAPAPARRFQHGARSRGQTGGQNRGRSTHRMVTHSQSGGTGRAQPLMGNTGRGMNRGMHQPHPAHMGRSRTSRGGNRGMPFRQHPQHPPF